MKYLVLLAYLLNIAFADPTTKSDFAIIYSATPEQGRSIVALANYEDIKIDFDRDGKIDYWHLKQDGLTVEITFKGSSPFLYTVRKVTGSDVREFGYRLKGNSLALLYANNRKIHSFHYDEPSEFANSCQETLKDLNSQLKKFSQELSEDNIFGALEENLIDSSCDEQKDLLAESIALALDKNDKISNCLAKNGKFRKSLSPGTDNDLKTEIISAQYELQKRQLVENGPNFKSTFRCEKAPKNRTERAVTKESGSITFYLPVDGSTQLKVVQHELIHRAGPFPEDLTKKIIDVCTSSEKQPSENKTENTSDSDLVAANSMMIKPEFSQSDASISKMAALEASKSGVANTKEIANSKVPVSENKPSKDVSISNTTSPKSKDFDGINAAARTSTATIPKELTSAQASIPSSDSLTRTIYNPSPNTEAGAKAALNNSYAQSKDVFKTANNLMGAMNNPALAKELAASKTAVTNRVTELAITTSGTNTRLPASATPVGLTGTSIKSDEVVTEEVILADKPDAATRSQASSTSNGQLPASVSRSDAAAQATKAIPTSTSTVKSGGGGEVASSSENIGNTGSQVSLGSGSQNIQRQPASRARATATASVTGSGELSKEEIISFMSGGSIDKVRKKLKDPDFASQLKIQKVKVLDTYGNSFGAEDAKILFLENEREQRFVRKK